MVETLSSRELDLIDAYWRTSNCLTVGRIYLKANPLLREPPRPEHMKPRLLGHWGKSPGQNFAYVHLGQLIRKHEASILYLSAPGDGGPWLFALTYLDGTYSEIYREVPQDSEGTRHLLRQFSSPGGAASQAGAHLPGSINEGGELGCLLEHSFDAAFDDPELCVACVIGDGEAETAPREGS